MGTWSFSRNRCNCLYCCCFGKVSTLPLPLMMKGSAIDRPTTPDPSYLDQPRVMEGCSLVYWAQAPRRPSPAWAQLSGNILNLPAPDVTGGKSKRWWCGISPCCYYASIRRWLLQTGLLLNLVTGASCFPNRAGTSSQPAIKGHREMPCGAPRRRRRFIASARRERDPVRPTHCTRGS